MPDRTPPVVNGTAWWTLRRNFQRTLPKTVTDTYLAAVLSLQERPAKDVLRNLKLLGLVGEDNEPTELANKWRDDDQYAEACQEIASYAYPDELLAAVPGPEPNTGVAAQWFQRSRRLGQGAARNAARTYRLVISARLSEDDGGGTSSKAGSGSRNGHGPKKKKPERATRGSQGAGSSANPKNRDDRTGPGAFEMPRPQIAVQVNIAPDMTADQIDQVFASMARHFYSQGGAE